MKPFKIICILLFFLLVAFTARALFFWKPGERRRRLVSNVQNTARRLLKAFQIDVELRGGDALAAAKKNAHLILANHLSYTDVLVLASSVPCIFVTSVEVRQSPFLGMMATNAGSLFVERRNKAALLQEIQGIADVLKEGVSVVVFPEGTTGNGERLLPFKVSLLSCAIASQVDVLPVCINYSSVNGKATNTTSRDSVFYYGSMEFFDHLKRLLRVTSIRVALNFLATIPVAEAPDRKTLAIRAFAAIEKNYVPVPVS